MTVGGWLSYETPEDKEYRFKPLKSHCIRFKVKAIHDCHLALSPVENDNDDIVEIFIGAWEGQSSAIRYKKGDDLTKVDTPGILDENEVKEFWVTFEDNEIKVGHGGDHSAFMQATLPEPQHFNFYGYSTGWGATGWWQFYDERVLQTDDCLDYNYEPIYGTSLVLSVKCSNDAHIALTSGPQDTDKMYEIFIGGWENQKSAIRLNKDTDMTVATVDTPDIVCADNEKNFHISFKNGVITVSKLGEDPFLVYTNPDPWPITHFGYCTGWGSKGEWKFE